MSVIAIVLNNLSMILLVRRAVAVKAKGRFFGRCLNGFQLREWEKETPNWDIRNQDEIDWSDWEWRVADKTICGVPFPGLFGLLYHETWAALELGMPRFVMAMAIILVGYLINKDSVSARVDP